MNTDKIKCLDKGHIQYVDHMGDDKKIVNAARQSYAGKGSTADEKLIRYMLEHGHNTPFEHCVITVEVRAPIFVIRQWHRHRTQSFSEVSGRYVELDMGYYVPDAATIGVQSETNHQGRDLKVTRMGASTVDAIEVIQSVCHEVYRKLLNDGTPREIARTVLPVSTYSQYWATANLQNWLRFLWERMDGHAQYEIRVFANAVFSVLEQLYPVTMAIWHERFIAAGRAI